MNVHPAALRHQGICALLMHPYRAVDLFGAVGLIFGQLAMWAVGLVWQVVALHLQANPGI